MMSSAVNIMRFWTIFGSFDGEKTDCIRRDRIKWAFSRVDYGAYYFREPSTILIRMNAPQLAMGTGIWSCDTRTKQLTAR
jgi:hypothetical protein